MNVSLTPELERFIHDLVSSGQYRSASEVVRAAIRLLKAREEERQAKLEALRREVRDGLRELERGEGISSDEVFREILAALGATEAA